MAIKSHIQTGPKAAKPVPGPKTGQSQNKVEGPTAPKPNTDRGEIDVPKKN